MGKPPSPSASRGGGWTQGVENQPRSMSLEPRHALPWGALQGLTCRQRIYPGTRHFPEARLRGPRVILYRPSRQQLRVTGCSEHAMWAPLPPPKQSTGGTKETSVFA